MKKYLCPICDTGLSFEGFYEHMDTHNGYSVDNFLKEADSFVFKKHKSSRKIKTRSGECHYCGLSFKENPKERTKDHVVPLSKGGTNHASNIVYACKRCNSNKGSRDYEEFIKTKVVHSLI